MADFKPNIYPIMYWGLMYGLIAGFVLFLLFLMSRFITLVWFPVFLVGVIWGGYRNYKKQKSESGHVSTTPKTALEEFKEAARDIVGATREMVAEQAEEAAQEEEAAAAAATEEDAMAEAPALDLENENDALVAQAPVEDEIVATPPAPYVAPPAPPTVSNPTDNKQTPQDQPGQTGQPLNK